MKRIAGTDYQELLKAVENYRSALVWCEIKPCDPGAVKDCNRAREDIQRVIGYRYVAAIIDLVNELEEAKERIAELETQNNPNQQEQKP
ncbi:hypothetical protein [Escherichia coli]|uniref:Phage protein n=1 Tax=Escherichia coli TaxID=562 RepID=A0A244BGB4_ECOLX|nr:hypothetical protein [Escherichia coli]EEU9149907.1 hypothetical protein [Escherichia coli]EEU9482583.1 hypothetical protein [Escherichia coli]EEW2347962.1 hypothetical protein [Escherichia coli]EFA7485333.1 hypothetical protein [Escherichia coli]EFB6609506.1 hypothetical protein [Escherichia coli]